MTSQELEQFLSDARARLLATVEATAPELLTRRPTPERWSPIEVVEHVALVERWFVQIVSDLADEGTNRGLLFKDGMVRTIDALPALNAQVDLRRPMQAAEFVHPTGRVALPRLLEQLSQSRQDLLGLLPALDQLDTDQLKHVHPTQRFELNAYQWVHLSGLHDRIHTRQIRQALEGAS
jgi:hypothetical protein